jgi:mono/diheme cytochrome c family protein
MKRVHAWMAVLAAFAIAGAAAVRADDDEGRAEHDVRVRLRVSRRGGAPVARVRVKNRGTSRESGVRLEIRADSESGALLWTGSADLRRHRAKAFRIPIVPPEGATSLVAIAALDGAVDGNPWDNVARAFLDGSAGGPAGSGEAAAGAALYAASCASCHGAGARGIGEAPGIRHRRAEEILEAMREGEEGMPTFPAFGAAEARALAAFLADPEGAVPPPPPPPPPPGTAPTYAGQVKALLDSRCGACHTGANASANLRFDTYSRASANAAAALAAVQAGRMPLGGSLTAEEIALLQAWIDGGKLP